MKIEKGDRILFDWGLLTREGKVLEVYDKHLKVKFKYIGSNTKQLIEKHRVLEVLDNKMNWFEKLFN